MDWLLVVQAVEEEITHPVIPNIKETKPEGEQRTTPGQGTGTGS
jgi:hypothetical protein